jgi:hypothetical protein
LVFDDSSPTRPMPNNFVKLNMPPIRLLLLGSLFLFYEYLTTDS